MMFALFCLTAARLGQPLQVQVEGDTSGLSTKQLLEVVGNALVQASQSGELAGVDLGNAGGASLAEVDGAGSDKNVKVHINAQTKSHVNVKVLGAGSGELQTHINSGAHPHHHTISVGGQTLKQGHSGDEHYAHSHHDMATGARLGGTHRQNEK